MGGDVAAIRFCAFLLGLLGLLFLLIATPTHHWFHDSSPKGPGSNVTQESYGGIFETCDTHTGSSGYYCHDTKGHGYVKATKAFMVLAIIMYILIVVYTLVLTYTKGISYKVLSVLTVIAGVFILVAMSIYTDQHKPESDDSDFKFGYSFALGWTSAVFTIIAGILIFFGKPEYQNI